MLEARRSVSWWVYLEDDGESVPVARHAEGGTYVIGGLARAELNVTYNYGQYFRDAWPEPIIGGGALGQMLHGKRASNTLTQLEQAVEALGTDTSDDYWEATPGNAGAALAILRDWAVAHPEATWSVS
jgi:hypothetical protein